MEGKGFYKVVNGELTHAPNGIILPNTTEPTKDKEILEANGWKWHDEKPILEENESTQND